MLLTVCSSYVIILSFLCAYPTHVCVCVHTLMHMHTGSWMCTGICMNVCTFARERPCVSFLRRYHVPCHLRWGLSLTRILPIRLSPISLPPHSWDLRHIPTCLTFFFLTWVPGLMSALCACAPNTFPTEPSDQSFVVLS